MIVMYQQLPIYQKSLAFSLAVIKFQQKLPKGEAIRVISYQLIRSSTSIAANIAEGSQAYSRQEFIYFYQVALKSAVESEHWLILLEKLGHQIGIQADCSEIIKILTAIIKKSKQTK